VAKEITPNINKWEEDGILPRYLYKQAADIGVLAPGFPVEFGGLGNDSKDLRANMIVVEELCRAGSGGLIASLCTLSISLHPVIALARPELAKKVATEVLAGTSVCALGITEPGGGSDVANLTTTARRDGHEYILNGEKTFITSGMQAEYFTLAVRTGGPGASGVSLLLVERDTPGFTRTRLDKMGWLCSDTATLHFDNCRVPASNLLGEENKGFSWVMKNFNGERIFIAGQCVYFSKELIKQASEYAGQRKTFGKRLIEHQAMRHLIVDMVTKASAAEAYLNTVLEKYSRGEDCVADISMLKNVCTECFHFCANAAVQVMGGSGFIRGHMVERLYRETKVLEIGGGSTEIMKDLAAKQLGLFNK